MALYSLCTASANPTEVITLRFVIDYCTGYTVIHGMWNGMEHGME